MGGVSEPNSPTRTSTRSSARGHVYADLAQDDADALLAIRLADTPAPLDAPDADVAALPPNHPIAQLVREAAWLLSHPAFAA